MKTTSENLALFKELFTGRTDVYGSYDPATGRVWQVKEPVTDSVILSHLDGKKPYGIYLLMRDRTSVAVVDFDINDPLPPLEFIRRARQHGIPAYIEISKSKGHHVWIFFDQSVLAKKVRRVLRFFLEEIGHRTTEIFPKQDCLYSDTSYGNFINAPLFGSYVSEGRTVFVDENTMEPFPAQWNFLKSIHQVSEELLDNIIEQNQLRETLLVQHDNVSGITEYQTGTFGLRPCAQRMLKQGVTSNQRVACFRLAVQLSKTGLPYECALAALKIWAQKNRPTNEKSIITVNEIISQTKAAYDKKYRGCGCDDEAVRPFCDPECSLYVNAKSSKKISNTDTLRSSHDIPE